MARKSGLGEINPPYPCRLLLSFDSGVHMQRNRGIQIWISLILRAPINYYRLMFKQTAIIQNAFKSSD
jgi:hypothetical protein